MATSNAPLHLLSEQQKAPATVLPAAASAAPARVSYAGLITRTIAFAIDAAIINVAAITVAAVIALVLSVFPTSHDMKKVLEVVGAVMWVVWLVAYFVTFWTTTGETPGNRVMRIRVVRADGGGRVRPGRALARFAGLVIGLPFFLGYLPILVTDRRRGLQDVMGRTVVVNRLPDSPSTPTRGTLP
jgi:uncharacterized RDD family membrane protein YckC